MKEKAQMSISITRHQLEYVRAKVKGGWYSNASEVVREALRRLEQEDLRAVRAANPTADDLLSYLTREQLADIRKRIRASAGTLKKGKAGKSRSGGEIRGLLEGLKG